MQSIKLKSHVGPDGVLKLEVPVGLTDVDLEIMVIVQPLTSISSAHTEKLGWPPGFFERTYGSMRDEPLVREPQGEYEVRDEIK